MRPAGFLPSTLFCISLFHFNASSQQWRSISALADSMHNQRKIDSAIVLGTQALSIAKREYAETDTTIGRLYERLGRYTLNRGGRWQEAIELLLAALHIQENAVGLEDSSLTQILLSLGYGYFQNANYLVAEEIFKRHIRITEKIFGAKSSQMSKPLEILGVLYKVIGRYNEAEALHRRNLDIRIVNLGPEHPDIASSLQNLSVIQLERGKFLEAESLSVRTLNILARAYGYESSQVTGPLNNLGEVYCEEGKVLKAKQSFLEALRLKEKFSGKTSTWTISTLNNLGVVYNDLGMPDSAQIFLERALSVLEMNYGSENPSNVPTLQKMAKLLYGQRKYFQAESLLNRSKVIAERSWGPNHIAFSTSLLLLANLNRDLERYPVADSLYQKVIQLRTDVFGSHNPLLAECFEEYGTSLRLQGKSDKSFESKKEAFRIADIDFRKRSSILGEKEAIVLSNKLHKHADDVYSIFFVKNTSTASDTLVIADIALAMKARNADAAIDHNKWLSIERDSIVANLADEYRSTRLLLSRRFIGGSTKNTKEHKSLVDSLVARCESLEAELARRSRRFTEAKANWGITSHQIVTLITPNTTVIEFLKWTFIDPKSTPAIPHYMAFVFDKKSLKRISELGRADKIEKLMDQYHQHFLKLSNLERPISKKDQREYNSISRKLYNLVWAPIAQHIPNSNTLFIAPDGALNLISFAGLMDEKGKYLIEKHPLHYLSAGRDLIRLSQDSTASGTGLLALGDPDYNATAVQRISNEKVFALNTAPGEVAATRNVRSSCETLSELKVLPLRNTKTEVDAIANYFPSSNVFEGRAANEENFKKNATGRKAIHIATHGYFISGECQEKLGKKSDSYVGENPLLQSGLFLAGANLHGSDIRNDEAEDGIVTALEVSAMDLRGTDLVVLSACETGLGKVEQGEGVYGLRRAFQMAGAKTVVSSLWQVPDDETMKFMKTLYSTKAKTYPELMQQVALQRIREARLRGRPTHPFTWGAFVATGEWRIAK